MQVATAVSLRVNDDANLRSGPSTNHERVGAVLVGAEIQVDGCNDACDWYHLATGEWIAGFLLDDPPSDLPRITEQAQSPEAVALTDAADPVANDNANLHSGPGTIYVKVGSVAAGAALEIAARNADGDWYQLADGTWIAAFLVDGAPQELPTASATAASGQTAPATEARPAFFIVDAPALIGLRVGQAEAILGPAVYIAEMEPGDLESIPYGGESRDYSYNGTSLSVEYDNSGIARSVTLGTSLAPGTFLETYDITLDQWPKLLAAMGLSTSRAPVRQYPYTNLWRNVDGYRVQMVASRDEVVWLIEVRNRD